MKAGGAFLARRNQLQWVALLAVAVILPTVSLLWFMSQVVANERLVVRQKLAALYQGKLADATSKTESLSAARLEELDRLQPHADPYALLRHLVLHQHVQGVVVWDTDGSVIYPRSADIAGGAPPLSSPLAEAWQQEFAGQHYPEAAQLYERLSADPDPRVAVAALLGRSRCLSKLGRSGEAIEACQKAAFTPLPPDGDPVLLDTVVNARLLLLSLLQRSEPSPSRAELLQQTLDVLENELYKPGGGRGALPATQNLFIAKKVLQALRRSDRPEDAKTRDQLERFVAAEELSLAAAETLRPFAGPADRFFPTDLDPKPIYGLRHRTPSSTILVLWSGTGITSALAGYQSTFAGSESTYRILDASGNCVVGPQRPEDRPFATAALPPAFPGWKVELYFAGGDVFEKAAKRQIAVYIWTGALVILLILVAGGFATQAVGKQIRLNRMKNDFIGTVSHELKTPLASMRVLVDTLLEGRVRDEAQAREYLRLTAKENERLSRMIDNFLTFSRMERNKVAFSPAAARPAAIAQDALESVQTKFATNNCRLTVEIAEPLPETEADHDAMVTVLVNLLDNACKYTTDNKQVALRVFAEAGFVCFAVSDNGIGLARRHIRRIFDRFYQVDSSLARKAEGCGLGLSIVKFIVDAHSGKIEVESKPGKGTTFTVRLPAAPRNDG